MINRGLNELMSMKFELKTLCYYIYCYRIPIQMNQCDNKYQWYKEHSLTHCIQLSELTEIMQGKQCQEGDKKQIVPSFSLIPSPSWPLLCTVSIVCISIYFLIFFFTTSMSIAGSNYLSFTGLGSLFPSTVFHTFAFQANFYITL
jgi:hypothetical protein